MSESEPVWLVERRSHVRALRELLSKVQRVISAVDEWSSAVACLYDLYIASQKNQDNTSEAAGNNLNFSVPVTLLQSLQQLSTDIQQCIRKCTFIDPSDNVERIIGAKVGVVGREKTGKSTFLSSWATGGLTLKFLPSSKAVCTGTMVRINSIIDEKGEAAGLEAKTQTASNFIGVISFFSRKEFTAILRALVVKTFADKVATDTPFITDDNLEGDVAMVSGWLSYSSPIPLNSLSHSILLSYCTRWKSMSAHIGRSPEKIQASDAEVFGQDLDIYVNVNNERSLTSAVKLVDIYARLPGISTGIQLNDVPGNGSANDELNHLASTAMKDMDVLLYLKETYHHPNIDKADKETLQAIKALRNGLNSTLIVCSNIDEDFVSLSGGNAAGKLGCELAVNDFKNNDIPVRNFHFVSSFLHDRAMRKVILDSTEKKAQVQRGCNLLQAVMERNGIITSGSYAVNLNTVDGFDRLFRGLSDILSHIPSFDRENLSSLKRRSQDQILALRRIIESVHAERWIQENVSSEQDRKALAFFLKNKLIASIEFALNSFVSSSASQVLYRFMKSPFQTQTTQMPDMNEDKTDDKDKNSVTNQRLEDEKLIEYVGECFSKALDANRASKELPNPFHSLHAVLAKNQGFEVISFALYEGWLRRIIFENFLKEGLTALLEQERLNAIMSIDACVKTALKSEANGGSLAKLFLAKDHSKQIDEVVCSVATLFISIKKNMVKIANWGSLRQMASDLFRRMLGMQPGMKESAVDELRAEHNQRKAFVETIMRPLDDQHVDPGKVGGCLHTINMDWTTYKQRINAMVQWIVPDVNESYSLTLGIAKKINDIVDIMKSELEKELVAGILKFPVSTMSWMIQKCCKVEQETPASTKTVSTACENKDEKATSGTDESRKQSVPASAVGASFARPTIAESLNVDLNNDVLRALISKDFQNYNDETIMNCEANLEFGLKLQAEYDTKKKDAFFKTKLDAKLKLLDSFLAENEKLRHKCGNLKKDIAELNRVLDNPRKNRHAYLSSIFCVPFELREEDFRVQLRSQSRGDNAKDLIACLRLKSKKLFIELEDFPAGNSVAEEMKDKFPSGTELSMLDEMLLGRARDVYEHLIELLKHALAKDQPFQRSREHILYNFRKSLIYDEKKKSELEQAIVDGAQYIWPKHFQPNLRTDALVQSRKSLEAALESF